MAEQSFSCSGGGEDAMWKMMGPSGVDQMIRHAIQHCWMVMPPARKNVEEVSTEIRRVVDRALKDLKEDASSFGFTS